MPLLATLVVLLSLAATTALADTGRGALVAVATNFLPTAEALEARFETETGREIRLVAGSTGKLAAQILAGAPFDALLAADAERPALLIAEDAARPETLFTYALGRLALWSADPDRIGADGAATLRENRFRRLAIANPRLAPYGAAAMETLAALGLAERLGPKLVTAENVGQAHALIATGNAELGFTALPNLDGSGGHWAVPEALHAPIRQDAILTMRADPKGAAAAFLAYLQTAEARAEIEARGYALP